MNKLRSNSESQIGRQLESKRGSKVFCAHEINCNGCQLLHLNYDDQIKLKLEDLNKYTGISAKPIVIRESALRDRADFIWTNQNELGLYSKDQSKIIDIQKCIQLSDRLQEAFFRVRTHFTLSQFILSHPKGSFRLRVSPQGKIGIWIDFSNIDIKRLLEEQKLLRSLMEFSTVEIGRKGKTAKLNAENKIKLSEPEFHKWFQTLYNNEQINIYSLISSFTQPSLLSNEYITKLIADLISHTGSKNIFEYGCGIGNLTFPALSTAESVTVLDNNLHSLNALKMSLNNYGMSDKVTILERHKNKNLNLNNKYDAALINPPRAGVEFIFDELIQLQAKQIIYMSCFTPSLSKDLKKFTEHSYQVKEAYLIDQFPQTKHYESLVLLERK